MKYFYTLLALLCVVPCFAQEESRLFVAPGRETYFRFPTQTFGEKYTLRVYLPEQKAHQAQKYPVVYLLGLEKEEREAIKNFVEKNSALVVWVDFSQDDLARDTANIVQFFTRELLPYIDINYFTFGMPEKRILAAYGKPAAQVALALLEKPNLFNYASFNAPQNALEDAPQWPASARAIVSGTQHDLALSQRALEKAGAQFATQFVLHYDNGQNNVLRDVDLSYFFAPKDQLKPVKLRAFLSEKQLPLQQGKTARLLVTATLKNKSTTAFVPETLRISPPFLEWNFVQGTLAVRPGAERGKVKITAQTDDLAGQAVLKLKKP